MDQRHLVLGAVAGYAYARLAPFVNSLRDAGFQGDVVLADFGALDAATRASLAAEGVELAPVDRRLLDPGFLHVSCARYFAYADLLRSRGASWDRVLVTDVRDVVFQADPFAADTGGALACFLEDERKTLATEPYNANWIRVTYGPEALDRLGRFPVCCSGTTMGSTAAVLAYLDAMARSILERRARGPLETGADQAIHNTLLWTRQLDDVVVFPNGVGNVLTLAIAPPEDVRFDAAGRLLNRDGTLPAIIHQYDRHAVLAALLEARYASPPARAAAEPGADAQTPPRPGGAPASQTTSGALPDDPNPLHGRSAPPSAVNAR